MEDTTIEDMLKTVEAAFAQKDYRGALQILETHQSKISPGLWHYNVGTIYGKLGNFPLSRYHLLMADQEGLRTKEVITNRNLVETKLEIDKYEKPLVWTDYLIKGSLAASEGIFATIGLLLVVFALFSLWKKKSFKAFGIIVTLFLIISGINVWVHSWDKKMVMIAQPLFEGPSQIFPAREEVPAGVLLITVKKGEWLDVIYPSRFKGWIKDSGLKELK